MWAILTFLTCIAKSAPKIPISTVEFWDDATMKTLAEKLKSEQCRRILEALESGPKSQEELVQLTKLTAGSIAKHVDVLLEAKLVQTKRNGKFSK
jgi:DNA-binding MarR family transcriptional regulator